MAPTVSSSRFRARPRSGFPSLSRVYYVCRKCGKANRVPGHEINPTARGVRRTIDVAKEIRSRFLESFAAYNFNILVWGPSAKNQEKAEVFNKRKEIRDLLRGKNQSAYFSEELQNLRDDRGEPLPNDVAELIETEFFDLVVNIADSPGSLMEADKFARGLLHRCLLWLRKEGQKGYASGLADSLASLRLPPLYFDDEDIRSCVLAKASEDWVHRLRMYELSLDIEQKRIDEVRIRRKRWVQ